jgi:hypothetical protein
MASFMKKRATYRRGDAATSALRPDFSVAVAKVFDWARVQ